MIPLGLMMKNINLREVNLSNVEGVVVGGEKDTVVNPEYTAGNEAPPQYSSAGR